MKKMILSLLVVGALAGSIIKATEEPTGAATGIVGRKKFDDKATKDLFTAVQAGNLVAVKAALDHGAEVNGKSDYGYTPLHCAAINNHLLVVQALLAAGADVKAKNDYGETPLHRAAELGHLDVVECLLVAGADVNAHCGIRSWAALDLAVRNGHLAIVRLLLAAGAKVNAKDFAGWPTLHWAAYGGDLEVVRYLLTLSKVDLELTDSEGKTAEMIAIAYKHYEIANLISIVRAARHRRWSLLRAGWCDAVAACTYPSGAPPAGCGGGSARGGVEEHS